MPGLNHTSQFKLYANGLGTNWSVLELFETLKEKKIPFFQGKKESWNGCLHGTGRVETNAQLRSETSKFNYA